MVKIRLRRMGSRNHPFYRVVVSDTAKVPTAAALEEIGYYNPRKSSIAVIDQARVDYWVRRGAQLSKTLETLLARQGKNTGAGADSETPTEAPSPVPPVVEAETGAAEEPAEA